MNKPAPQEYDVSKLAQTIKPKRVAGKATKIATICLGLAVIGGLFGYGLSQWFQPADFDTTISLDETITRFSPLTWITPETTLENKYGVWVRETSADPYSNENGCNILLANLKGASAVEGSDLEDTNLYSKIFDQPGNINIATTKDYVAVNNTGKIEVLKTTYDNSENTQHSVTLYRNTVGSETVHLAIVTCSNIETYNTIIDSETIAEDLNIRLEG